jgi:hypothetical protein
MNVFELRERLVQDFADYTSPTCVRERRFKV